LWQVNPDIIFEVFIHKVDGLSDDHKIGASSAVFVVQRRHESIAVDDIYNYSGGHVKLLPSHY
jgi:hypothetical protein